MPSSHNVAARFDSTCYTQITTAEACYCDMLTAWLPFFAEDDPYAKQSQWSNRNPVGEDTETRFETESDMMELCDLAEILVGGRILILQRV